MTTALKLLEATPLLDKIESLNTDIEKTVDYTKIVGILESVQAHVPKEEVGAPVKALLLRKIHQLFATAYKKIPLHPDVWEMWQRTIGSLFEETSAAYLDAKEACAQEYHEAFLDAFWGSTFAFQLRVQNLEELASRAMNEGCDPLKEGEETNFEKMLQSSIEQYFKELQLFAHMRYMHEHLFEVVAQVGVKEREFIEGTFLTREKVALTLLRRSFKRDALLPSTGLMQLQDDFFMFELDASKGREFEHLFRTTLDSKPYMLSKRILEAKRQNHSEKATVQASADVDSLVKEYISSHPHRALGLSFQRLVETEPFPAVLNPSRLEFFLYLILQFNKSYTSRSHRWTYESPFVSPDDSDFIRFILSRHTCLLRWALLYPQIEETSRTCTIQSNYFPTAISSLQLVLKSVVDNLHFYLHSRSVSQSTTEKRNERRRCAIKLASDFFEETVVPIFAKSLLNGLYDFLVGTEPAVQATVFLLEAELKMALCDTGLALTAANRSSAMMTSCRERLGPLLEDLVEFLKTAEDLPSDTFLECILLSVRLVSRIGVYAKKDTTKEGEEFLLGLYNTCKEMVKLAARSSSAQAVHMVQNAWEGILGLTDGTDDSGTPLDDATTIVSPKLYERVLSNPKFASVSLQGPQHEARRALKNGPQKTETGLKRMREE
ncbi:hypothetical protein ADEAN_000373500 [Angomonas deanei]|uniref:Uncharacterized protein n=1 Tax=Angomonas deanei TaxID=59799 RepID=A0A7G2CBG3_9TRYP|nr:hypothetical protein ADEAN_000373500 [Angomonas deanei]